jgi:HD-GYP domain-containing protein (c-di-GMP phosphodiesterase class II)
MLFAPDRAAGDPGPARVKPIRSLAILLAEEFSIPFRFYDAATGAVIEGVATDDEAASTIRQVADGVARVQHLEGNRFRLVLPFPDLVHTGGAAGVVAVGVIGGLARTPAELAVEQSRLGKWVQLVHQRLTNVSQSDAPRRHRSGSEPGRGALVGLEALMGLEQLLRTQRIEKDPVRNRKQILETAAGVVRACSLVWVPPEAEESQFEGEPVVSCWDCGQLAQQLAHDGTAIKAGYLIDNRVQSSPWGARLPQVSSLLAIPVPIKNTAQACWLIALNKLSRAATPSAGATPDGMAEPGSGSVSSTGSSGPGVSGAASFRRTDAVLLLPFAALLGVHLRAARRHAHFKALVVGLTRWLGAAVDAHDSFVAGHSERVARIAVELARELGLGEDELNDVYLGGLLHDIGKLGMSDAILQKRDPLTPDEMAQVRQHVSIGSHLLGELPPMAHLLPAVLHHHERFDGTGYPDGLKGDTIPFLARILAVAESYDAMTSYGPLRPATVEEDVEVILSRGADAQWDGRVVAAFFRCRERIRAIQSAAG